MNKVKNLGKSKHKNACSTQDWLVKIYELFLKYRKIQCFAKYIIVTLKHLSARIKSSILRNLYYKCLPFTFQGWSVYILHYECINNCISTAVKTDNE